MFWKRCSAKSILIELIRNTLKTTSCPPYTATQAEKWTQASGNEARLTFLLKACLPTILDLNNEFLKKNCYFLLLLKTVNDLKNEGFRYSDLRLYYLMCKTADIFDEKCLLIKLFVTWPSHIFVSHISKVFYFSSSDFLSFFAKFRASTTRNRLRLAEEYTDNIRVRHNIWQRNHKNIKHVGRRLRLTLGTLIRLAREKGKLNII